MKNFIYMNTMKESRKLYKNMGLPLMLFLILFGLANKYIFFPLMGKLWGLVLMTTPEGFISNANIVDALVHSPWIIPLGLVFVVLYALLAMWQVSAILVGIGYLKLGHKVNLRDLIKISFSQLKDRLHKRNWMILVYSMIILPLANVYQTNDLISTFVIPEYIQDFINNNLVLSLVFLALMLFLIYIALRWFFVLPSFFLKGKDFKQAKSESLKLTSKNYIKNGINIGIYYLWELVRLSLIPMLFILIPLFICYRFTYKLEYATNLFSTLGVSMGLEVIKNITGTLVQVSSMCFLVQLYSERQKELVFDENTALPDLDRENTWKFSVLTLQVVASIIFSIVLCSVYLVTVHRVQKDNDFIFSMFLRTEIIAHKGYSSKAPENTMPAFDKADKCDAVTAIELDVWSTKDGIPVVIHNSTIKDATGVDKAIYDCTYEELKNLVACYSMSENEFPDARIPSLEEVIAKYAFSTPLLIEIKGFKNDPLLPEKIVQLLKKYNCENICSIHSGDYGALKAVKLADPNIECGLILAMVTGNYYDLPYADFFSIEHTFVNQNIIANLHNRGKRIFAWTVNYSDSAKNLMFSDVDGIITDVPEEIETYVANTNELIDDVFISKLEKFFKTEEAQSALKNYITGNY